MNLNLSLLNYTSQLRLSEREGTKYVYDVIRKKDIVLLPEEMVRQCILLYLLNEVGISQNHIRVEKGIKVNGLFRRSDIIIYDRNALPKMIIEVKRPEHAISQKVLNQVAMYNIPLQVPYLMVSNGRENYICKLDYENNSYEFVKSFPQYETLL